MLPRGVAGACWAEIGVMLFRFNGTILVKKVLYSRAGKARKIADLS